MSENKENLSPAILQTTDTLNEMSADEFRRSLLTWFEDRGIVSELRAHLRRHLIDILRETSLGSTVSQPQTSLSPRNNVINLLIAEFLMKNKYHYSLSVFSTEVPFISILPDYSPTLLNAAKPGPSNEDKNKVKKSSTFTEQNIWDILQILGFARDSAQSQQLFDSYFKSDESLIVCLILNLSNVCSNKTKPPKQPESSTKEEELFSITEPWLKDIYNLLIHYNIPSEILVQLREHLKSIFERERVKIKTEETTKLNFVQAQIQTELQNRETDVCRMINEMESTFFQEKQKLLEKLNAEQKKIDLTKDELKQKQRDYEDKLSALTRREEILILRESEVTEQTEILKTRIKVMQNVYDSVIEENIRINNIKLQQHGSNSDDITVDNNNAQAKFASEYELLRNQIQETSEIIQKFNHSMRADKTKDKDEINEEKLLKSILEHVQAENSQLRVLNNEQQRRIDDLATRNSQLMHDLENSQTTISILSRNTRRPAIQMPPPAPLPFNRPRLNAHSSNNLNGGGENLGFVPQPPPQPVYRHLAHVPSSRDSRRKIPRRLVVHTESSDERSSSPTDEVLQEARLRLRRLEQETEEVDRNYRAFKQRHSQLVTENLRMVFRSPVVPQNSPLMDQATPLYSSRINRDFHNIFMHRNRNNDNKNKEDAQAVMFNYKQANSSQKIPVNIKFQTNKSKDCVFSVDKFLRQSTSQAIPTTSKQNEQANVPLEHLTMNESFDNENMPSTSQGITHHFHVSTVGETASPGQMEYAVREDYGPSTGHSAASSGVLPPLHNLSISSIDMSTDHGEMSDCKSPERLVQ